MKKYGIIKFIALLFILNSSCKPSVKDKDGLLQMSQEIEPTQTQIQETINEVPVITDKATHAFYTLQFDLATAESNEYGKPSVLAVSMKNTKKVHYLKKSKDCVKIRKENLPNVTIVMIYTKQSERLLPTLFNEFCTPAELRYQCQTGYYNIYEKQKEQGFQSLMQKTEVRPNSSACAEFP